MLTVDQVDLRPVLADLRASFLARKDADLDGQLIATRSVRLSIIVADQYLLHDDSSGLRRLREPHRHHEGRA